MNESISVLGVLCIHFFYFFLNLNSLIEQWRPCLSRRCAVVSYLGLYCLPISRNSDARHEWVSLSLDREDICLNYMGLQMRFWYLSHMPH